LSLDLRAPLLGRNSVWAFATDLGGLESGWSALGVWEAFDTPQLRFFSPQSGRGPARTFSFSFDDIRGSANFARASIVFQRDDQPEHACSVDFDVAARTFSLNSDSGGWLPPASLNSPGRMNSFCQIRQAYFYTSPSYPNTLWFLVTPVFSDRFQGKLSAFVRATNAQDSASDWFRGAQWEATHPNQAPWFLYHGESPGVDGFRILKFQLHEDDTLEDIQSASLRIGTATSNPRNCIVTLGLGLSYFYLLNDAGSGMTSREFGSGFVDSNSQCEVDAAQSSVRLSLYEAEVQLAFRFRPTYAGAQPISVTLSDYSGQGPSAALAGSVVIAPRDNNQPPAAVSASTTAISGRKALVEAAFSDPDGLSDLRELELAVGGIPGSTGRCWLRYDRRENRLWLRDDANENWLGGYEPGRGGTIANQACSFSSPMAHVSETNGALLLSVEISILNLPIGSLPVLARATDSASIASDWTEIALWLLEDRPWLTYKSPTTGSGPARRFSAAFQSAGTYQNIKRIRLLVGDSSDLRRACAVSYDFTSNTAHLASDDGTSWVLLTGEPGHPSRANAQCRAISVSYGWSTTGRYIYATLSFTPAFAGPRRIFAEAENQAGLSSGWIETGAWTATAPNHPPVIESVDPASGSGPSGLLRIAISDADGGADLQAVWLQIGGAAGTNQGCSSYFFADNPYIYLFDSSTGATSYGKPGEAKTLQNDKCAIDLSRSKLEWSTDRGVITLSLEFKPALSGTQSVYLDLRDYSALTQSFQKIGQWVVP